MVLKLAPAMATPLRPVRRRRLVALLGGGLLCVLAVSAGIGLVLGAKAPSPSKAASEAAASRAAVKGAAPLMNSTQWSHLQASLANEPDRDAQTADVVSPKPAEQRRSHQQAGQRVAGDPRHACKTRHQLATEPGTQQCDSKTKGSFEVQRPRGPDRGIH